MFAASETSFCLGCSTEQQPDYRQDGAKLEGGGFSADLAAAPRCAKTHGRRAERNAPARHRDRHTDSHPTLYSNLRRHISQRLQTRRIAPAAAKVAKVARSWHGTPGGGVACTRVRGGPGARLCVLRSARRGPNCSAIQSHPLSHEHAHTHAVRNKRRKPVGAQRIGCSSGRTVAKWSLPCPFRFPSLMHKTMRPALSIQVHPCP